VLEFFHKGNSMKDPITISSDDPRLDKVNFRAYRNVVEREFKRFLPRPYEEQTMIISTPLGDLTVEAGSYLIREVDSDKYWPVNRDIFESTYKVVQPGYCIKSAFTYLAPLVELTGGDPDQVVIIQSLEGPETVRAGDYYLARGPKGELYPFPIGKVGIVVKPADE
jgi:hypothetical protein